MSKYATRFQDLEVWKEAHELAFIIYQETKEWNDYGLRNQIQRSIVSVSSNIAEGFDRSSHLEFKRFLNISRASLSETLSLVLIAQRLGYINNHPELDRRLTILSKRLLVFIRNLRPRPWEK